MDIPKELYYILGSFIVMNIGSIIGFMAWGARTAYKSGYEKAEIDMKIATVDNKSDRAHQRIDKIEHKVYT